MNTNFQILASVAISLLSLGLFPTAQCQAEDKPADPVALIKPILVKLEKDGTEENVTDFVDTGKWIKRKYVASTIKFDVKKTDSLVSPFIAMVTWEPKAYISGSYGTKLEAEKAEIPKIPIAGGTRWWAELAFQDGKWVIQDCGWKTESGIIDKRYSTLKNDKDPIIDWWRAFGGK